MSVPSSLTPGWKLSVEPLEQTYFVDRSYSFTSLEAIGGLRIRVSVEPEENLVTTVATVNAYAIEADGETWWLIGNCRIIGRFESRDENLSDITLLTAFLACMCLNVPATRIIFASREYKFSTLKVAKLGLRELKSEEMLSAPPTIRNLLTEAISPLSAGTALYGLHREKTRPMAVLMQRFLDRVEIRTQPIEAGISRSNRWAVRARKLLQGLKKIEKIELEIGCVDESWPIGEIGTLIQGRTGEIDGICVRVVCRVEGELVRLGRARVYQVQAQDGDWWVLGDPYLESVVRGNRLHDPLLAARILACLRLDVPAGRIILAPGRYAYKAIGLGFRELTDSELAGAPEAIHDLAAHSRKDAKNGVGARDRNSLPAKVQPLPVTGLYRLNEEKISEFIELAKQMTRNGEKAWYGLVRDVPRVCGERLRAVVAQMGEWPRRASS